MKCQPYHPHRPRGGGRRHVCLTTATGQPIALKTFNEQFAAAQLIQAQLLLGADRTEAEAFAPTSTSSGKGRSRRFRDKPLTDFLQSPHRLRAAQGGSLDHHS